MHPEKYSVKWHAYSDHLKSMMKELMMNEDFSDVTLVTEDKKQIKANINILSACSPVFKAHQNVHALGRQGRLPCFFLVIRADCPAPFW